MSYPFDDICIAMGQGISKSRSPCSGTCVELGPSRTIVLYTKKRLWLGAEERGQRFDQYWITVKLATHCLRLPLDIACLDFPQN